MKKTFIKEVIPNKLICKNNLYNIKLTNPEFIIKKFCVFLNDETEKIEDVGIIEGKHPNCDLKTKLFCIPEYLKNYKLDDNSFKIIINILEIFNFDSAFYQPWDSFEYVYVKEERILINGN